MRKILQMALAIVVLFILGYLVYKIVHKINLKNQIAENTATIG